MKKIIAILTLILVILSSTACDKKPTTPDDFADANNYNIVQTRNIVLGNEVNSVVLTTKQGEQLTFDTTAEFYEIFNNVGFTFGEEGKKYSSSAQTKLNDESKTFVNMNCYYYDNAEFDEFRAKKEGDDAVSAIEEYQYSANEEDGSLRYLAFARYTYKDEKAFIGGVSDKNGRVEYTSSNYPTMPEYGTELNEMQSRSIRLRDLLASTAFFANYEPFGSGDTTFDYNEFVTREYKLYENYIVFKQTAPFLNTCINGHNDSQTAIIHATISSSNDSITQEAYCNVKTGEIELIKIYGITKLHLFQYFAMPLEIDMQLYIHNLNETEVATKIANLINYVKSNSDQQ